MTLQIILKEIRSFVDNELIPIEKEFGLNDWRVLFPILDTKRDQIKAKGLWLPQISKSWGGLGLTLFEFAQVSAELGRSPFGHYCLNCQAPDAGNMEILIEFGTPLQQEIFLKPLLAGNTRSCFSMTEPEHAGSNPLLMSTTGIRNGNNYVVNGHKWFTTAADGAHFSIVMCVTNPDSDNPYNKASQIIVPLETEGYENLRNISIMGEAGHGWASHSEVKYHDCIVPKTYLLGEEGKGFEIAQSRLGPGRIHHCMRWLGICERAFDMMCKRALSRKISDDKVLADKQTIQNWIAESRAEINAARLMVLDTAKKIDQEGQYAARVEISSIKFYCASILQNVLDKSIQVHGALGTTDDLILSWWYRHERGSRIYDGADEVHKSSVARLILKNYK